MKKNIRIIGIPLVSWAIPQRCQHVSSALRYANVADRAAMYVGQSIGLIHAIPTCEDLLSKMVQEAEEQINKVQNSSNKKQFS